MPTINGTNGAEYLPGTQYDDTFNALNGDDIMEGGSGNDIFKGGAGADTLYGGEGTYYFDAGIDTASYADSNASVLVTLNSMFFDPWWNTWFACGRGYGGTAEGDTLFGIENLTGSGYSDTLIGDGGNNELSGQGGDDTLKGGGGADTLYGHYDNDTLYGGAGADMLYGGNGIDTAAYDDASSAVFVNLNNNVGMYGDAQGDTFDSIENLKGSIYDDQLYGSEVANVLDGRDGNDILWGNGGDDDLRGGDGTDTLRGDQGADRLDGGAGIDFMEGGTGNDTYYVDNYWDVLTEGSTIGVGNNDNDRVFASVDYTLAGRENVETLVLVGSAHTATGNGGVNTLVGNGLDNVLDGGAGFGDSLSGGGGNDTFVFHAGEAQGDTIYDFQGNGAMPGDSLKFVGYGTQAAGASFVHLSGNDWQVNSADGLHHDTITIVGGAMVDPSDVLFVM